MVVVKIAGGLGNQMFQSVLALWLQNKGKDVKLDTNLYIAKRNKIYSADELHNGYEMNSVFCVDLPLASKNEIRKYTRYGRGKILNKFVGYKKTHITRKYFGENKWYYPELERMDNIYLDGYWCTFSYADDIEEIIREKFVFPELQGYENISMAREIQGSNSISVHIRRGDYLNLQDRYDILSIKYYNRAITYFCNLLDCPTFFVFSDDIEWCKKNININNAFYIDWNKGNNCYMDMQLMSMCKHNIVANSTFSMWAAWLNLNSSKIIIRPKNVFVNASDEYVDMFPKEWRILENK